MDHRPHIVVVEDEATQRQTGAPAASGPRVRMGRRKIEAEPAHPDAMRSVGSMLVPPKD